MSPIPRRPGSGPRGGPAKAFAVLAGLCMLTGVAAEESALPSGFAGVDIGDPWEQVASEHRFEALDSVITPWDVFLNECGAHIVRMQADNGELLVSVNDFLVTEVTFATPIKPGADLLEVAGVVMENYGEPEGTEMRNLFGQITDDKAEVNFITLRYRLPHPVEFSISGRALWEYQITARHPRARWHENRTLLCARKKEKAADRGARTSSSVTR